jgi:hypothetical protein
MGWSTKAAAARWALDIDFRPVKSRPPARPRPTPDIAAATTGAAAKAASADPPESLKKLFGN